MQADLADTGLHQEVALITEAHLRASETQSDRGGITAWRHQKIVLQLALGAVIDQVHAGVDCLILHSREIGHISPPFMGIASYKIIAFTRKFV